METTKTKKITDLVNEDLKKVNSSINDLDELSLQKQQSKNKFFAYGIINVEINKILNDITINKIKEHFYNIFEESTNFFMHYQNNNEQNFESENQDFNRIDEIIEDLSHEENYELRHHKLYNGIRIIFNYCFLKIQNQIDHSGNIKDNDLEKVIKITLLNPDYSTRLTLSEKEKTIMKEYVNFCKENNVKLKDNNLLGEAYRNSIVPNCIYVSKILKYNDKMDKEKI